MTQQLWPCKKSKCTLSYQKGGMELDEIHRHLQDKIRVTFLLAHSLKKWLAAVAETRKSQHSSLYAQASTGFRGKPPLPKVGHGMFGAQALLRLADRPETKVGRERRKNVSFSFGADGAQRRAAARLLHMVLRAPSCRALAGCMSTWRRNAAQLLGKFFLLQERQRHVTELRQSELLQRSATVEEGRKRLEAEAKAQLQGSLRQLEVQRREKEEKERNVERLMDVMRRTLARRELGSLARALSFLAFGASTRQVAELRQSFAASLREQQASASELECMKLLASTETAKRKSLETDIASYAAEDSKVSKELTRAVGSTARRGQLWALRTVVARISGLQTSHVVAAFAMLRCFSLRKSFDAKQHGTLENQWNLPEARRETESDGENMRRVEVIDASDVLLASPMAETPQSQLPETSFIAQSLYQLELSRPQIPSDPASVLAARADRLLKLKVRFGLRHDFAQRCTSTVIRRTETSGDSLASLRQRLDRGAACLLEYALASVFRDRLRVAINQWLSVVTASVRKRRYPSAQKVLPLRGRSPGRNLIRAQ